MLNISLNKEIKMLDKDPGTIGYDAVFDPDEDADGGPVIIGKCPVIV